MRRPVISVVLGLLTFLSMVTRSNAHAFIVRAEPRVGSKVETAPTDVRIWFSEDVQSASSSIQVFDANGKRVDKSNTHRDPANHALINVSLASGLKPGNYHVVWRVMSVDTHATNGDFRFEIIP